MSTWNLNPTEALDLLSLAERARLAAWGDRARLTVHVARQWRGTHTGSRLEATLAIDGQEPIEIERYTGTAYAGNGSAADCRLPDGKGEIPMPPDFVTIDKGAIAHAECVRRFNLTVSCGRTFPDCHDARCAISEDYRRAAR